MLDMMPTHVGVVNYYNSVVGQKCLVFMDSHLNQEVGLHRALVSSAFFAASNTSSGVAPA